jgi:hypothetical protein
VKRYGSWHPACAQGGCWRQLKPVSMRKEATCSSGLTRGIGKAEDPAAAARNCKKDQTITRTSCTRGCCTVEDTSASSKSRAVSTRVLEFNLAQGVLKFGSFVLKSGRNNFTAILVSFLLPGQHCLHWESHASAIMSSSAL